MFVGHVASLHIAPSGAAPMQTLESVRALLGEGIEGDRYATRKGTWSGNPNWWSELTLIEIEAIEALKREKNIVIAPADARRNIVTRHVPLNHLVGREFFVGEVRLLGIRLCEPCRHLDQLNCKGVRDGLTHRGGLRARILASGTLSVGDAIRPA